MKHKRGRALPLVELKKALSPTARLSPWFRAWLATLAHRIAAMSRDRPDRAFAVGQRVLVDGGTEGIVRYVGVHSRPMAPSPSRPSAKRDASHTLRGHAMAEGR